MRRLLLLLAVCSVPLVAAQSVLAIAPAPENPALASRPAPGPTGAGLTFAAQSGEADAAPVGSTAMLVAGLAGLTIAGGRREERLRRAR